MKKSIYSLLLADDMIAAVDELAYAAGTSRSNMVNQILAQYLSVKTPEMQMRDIFRQIESIMNHHSAFQIQLQPSDAMLSVRTALAYKYKPTVRYSVSLLRGDPQVLGELKVSARTQSAALLQRLDAFFRLWNRLENLFLQEKFPGGVPCRIEDGRYTRTLLWPQHSVDDEALGEAISRYIQNFDNGLKAFFALDEHNWKAGIEQIGRQYEQAMQQETILL